MESMIKASDLLLSKIRLHEGDRGYVSDLLFDDEDWSLRYLVADIRPWSSDEKKNLLLNPQSILKLDARRSEISFDLSEADLSHLPDIHTDKPVYLQHLESIKKLKDAGVSTGRDQASETASPHGFGARHADRDSFGNTHLRSFREIRGYSIETADSKGIGCIKDFCTDSKVLQIEYLVSTENLIVAPDWISQVSFVNEQIRLACSREILMTHQDPEKWSFKKEKDYLHLSPKE